MLQYAICEVNKKQYKVIAGKELLVDFQDPTKEIDAKVLLLAEDGKVKIGKPYLKEKINLKIVDNPKGDKIRVGKFHAKANYRRTIGSRSKFTKIRWNVKTS